MKAWLREIWQATLLKTSALQRIAIDRDAFLRGFLLIIFVSLVVALPPAIEGFIDDVRVGREPVEVQAGLQTGLETARPWLEQAGVPAGVLDQLFARGREGAALGMDIGRQVNELPARLPEPLPQLARSLGAWLSAPFSDAGLPLGAAVLATWLGYGIWVMLFAKLLGGRADLPGFFGATALFAVPHLLGVFGLVPVLGPLLAVAAFVWGLMIYVKATAVSHELSIERALLAALAPFLLLVTALLSAAAVAAFFVALSVSR